MGKLALFCGPYSLGVSGSNARRMAADTWRIRRPDSGRGKRSPSSDFLSVVMK